MNEFNETFVNTTIPAPPSVAPPFSDAQKVVFVLSSVGCFVFGYYMYRIAKRGMDEGESYFGRVDRLYALCTGSLIGAILADVLPHAGYNNYAATTFGALIGLLVMLFVHLLCRVWHANNQYITPAAVVENQESLLDSKHITGNTHLIITGEELVGDGFPEKYVHSTDLDKDWQKRVIFSSILFVCIVFIVVMDGLFIVYWSARSYAGPWGMVTLSWVTRFFYSTIIYCSLIHGMFHTITTTVWWRWFFKYNTLSFVWFCVLVTSCSFMFSDTSVETATFIIDRWEFSFFYGIISGILIWQMSYFYWMHQENTTRSAEFKKYFIIFVVSLTFCLIGIFL